MAKKRDISQSSLISQKRMILVFILISALFLVLAFRIGWIQVVASDKYAKQAAENQTQDVIIPAKRGAIYGRNMKEMAVSAVSYKIWIVPDSIKSGKTEEIKEERYEKSLELLSSTLGLDKEELKADFDSDKKRIRIARDVEKDPADKIRSAIEHDGLTGIEIEEGISRYYPLGNFASHVLGSVSDEGDGQSGIELQYNKYLSGVAGRSIKNTDRTGGDLSYGNETLYEQKNGVNVVLTIDETIQHYVEKAIAKTCEQWNALRVSCIAMDPKTGDVLAMAVAPNYDPNNPRVPLDEEEAAHVETLTQEEQVEYWNSMWRNPLINDTYDPGSTFKLITVSAALEERVATPQDGFYCNGVYNVYGTELKCWRSEQPHGAQTLTQGVGNSCNPVMIQVQQRTGLEKFYQYVELFGFTEKTGIDYPSEAGSIVQDINTAGPVDLATMAYGQGIAVTPIEMITAVSAIGNGGNLMQPRLVKGFANDKGKIIEENSTKLVRQVISEETADEVKQIMEYVVDESGGKVAQVPGYRVGGKTGTTEKLVDGSYKTGALMGSMIAMAPMDDPQIVVLVVVDEPKGANVYGSTTAGPAVQEIMSEVMRYLNIQPSYTDQEKAQMQNQQVVVPNVTGMNFSDAAGALTGVNLKYTVSPEATAGEEFAVIDQYPKAGEYLAPGESVTLYRK